MNREKFERRREFRSSFVITCVCISIIVLFLFLFICLFIYSEDNDDNLDKSGEENGEIEEIIVSLVSLFGETMRLFRGGRGSPFDDVKL